MRFIYHYTSPGQVKDRLPEFLRFCREANINFMAREAHDGTAYVVYTIDEATNETGSTALGPLHRSLQWVQVAKVPARVHNRPLTVMRI